MRSKPYKFKVLSEIIVSEKKDHRYKSFPTLLTLNSKKLMAVYRDAYFETRDVPIEAGEHGLKGDIYIIQSEDNGFSWQAPEILYDHKLTGENEQHSVLSQIDDQIFITSRQWGEKYDNFISQKKLTTDTFSPRKLILPPKEFRFFATYGRIIKGYDNDFLLPVYGIAAKEKKGSNNLSSGLMRSRDRGQSWEFASFIAHSEKINFNETAVTQISKGRLLAAIRTEHHDQLLYQSISCDNGKTWSSPVCMNIRGEAPEFLRLDNQCLILMYRGFTPKKNIFSFTLSLSRDEGQTWESPFLIKKYFHSKYDGGYGNIVQVDNDLLCAVYYTCDQKRRTWINSSMIKFK